MKKPFCLRCNKPFVPFDTPMGSARFCRCCQQKNVFDLLDLPTPPLLLDKLTRHPTLTDAEWSRKIRNAKGQR